MKSTEQISRTLLLNTTLHIFCQFMSSFPSPLCEQSIWAQATKPVPNKKSNIMQHMYRQCTNQLVKDSFSDEKIPPFHSNRCPLASLECLPSLQAIQLLLSVAKGPVVFRRHLATFQLMEHQKWFRPSTYAISIQNLWRSLSSGVQKCPCFMEI